MRGFNQLHRWAWLNSAAFLCGLVPVVLALTVHNHGTSADPYCIRHCYTLVHVAGPAVLAFVGTPAAISLVVFALLHLKAKRHSRFADNASWWIAAFSCLICLLGLLTSVGLEMLPVAALTVCAVATFPGTPNPRPEGDMPRAADSDSA